MISRLLPVILITGCASHYYPNPRGTVTIEVVQDVAEQCGYGVLACAYAHDNGDCTVYLPERPTDNLILHEISHCWGRVDSPERRE